MPERNFFNLRYALPGYTFILIMILVAYPKLIEVIIDFNDANMDFTLVSALLAFLTLLSGSAIGFLISQFWYFFHNSFFNKFFLSHTRKFLRDTFNLKENTHQEIVFLDYVFHSSDKRTIEYVSRRFDLQHTLASTFLSIIFGLTFGIFIKVDFFSLNLSLWDSFIFLIDNGFTVSLPCFTLYDVGVTIIIFSLLIVLAAGFIFISREHSMMVDAAVREVVLLNEKITQNNIEHIFSEKYFEGDN